MSGYFTVASSLKDEFERRGPISAARLAGMTAEECRGIFGQEGQNGAAMELMGLFGAALNDLGRLLLAKYRGDVGRLIEAAGGSAEHLIGLLADKWCFRDVSSDR